MTLFNHDTSNFVSFRESFIPDKNLDGDVLCVVLQCIELLGANCFTQEQYAKLLGLLKDMLEMCFSRASERQAKRQDEDYDEQVEEELEEEVSIQLVIDAL